MFGPSHILIVRFVIVISSFFLQLKKNTFSFSFDFSANKELQFHLARRKQLCQILYTVMMEAKKLLHPISNFHKKIGLNPSRRVQDTKRPNGFTVHLRCSSNPLCVAS